MKITGRSSSITNAFINSIIPIIKPTNDQVKEALDILGMTYDTIQCAYCGDKQTEWDHLRPLVMNKMPTGYVSEIHNLLPSCGKCNQSKGNKSWDIWMISNAKLSPKYRGVKDVAMRMERIRKYESWMPPTKVNFEEIVGESVWAQHWENCSRVQEELRISQKLAVQISAEVKTHFFDIER